MLNNIAIDYSTNIFGYMEVFEKLYFRLLAHHK